MRCWFLTAAALGAAVLALWGQGQSRGKIHTEMATPTPAISSESRVVWETSFASAQARAQREGKPILLLHLFGRLDEQLC
ncbi:MAG: hypothetical protein NZT92_03795 [Abditibacteriales bacterium]|nr:hypothetical protein [Abditibacteriales bacterium]MDW8365095.1 hypothetical protein [Abditibacteriales bacterium]